MAIETYDYDVVISGMENVPLRTTRQGAKTLMTAFDKGTHACDILLTAMTDGIEFKNTLVTIKRNRKPRLKKKKTTRDKS